MQKKFFTFFNMLKYNFLYKVLLFMVSILSQYCLLERFLFDNQLINSFTFDGQFFCFRHTAGGRGM